MNDEILNSIKDELDSKNQNTDNSQTAEEKKQEYLIFLMNDEVFALESSLSREILHDLKVYPLPFVPKYVKGVLNRHGDPYTVVDPMILLSNPEQNSCLFLVCKIPEENFCIKITDVLEFYEVLDKDINKFDSINGIDFFKSSFLWKDNEVPILNIQSFLDRIKRDLNND